MPYSVIRTLCLLPVLFGLAGCVAPLRDSPSSAKYMVIGFGVLEVPKAPTHSNITAVNLKSFGLAISDFPAFSLGLGYTSSSVIAVPADIQHAVVEVSTCPAGDGIKMQTTSHPIVKKEL
ncbi:hypothetical protein EOE67_14475 [Rheinheimera riviphila]|uniref:Lipoprotein n=1 Tax=Rheinheimera riviphila TaxID=1834037 RepID=A0A437QLI1_9GAMM|nr:hypothetical protein [Rheinheimera riviphila]RVU35378.1 hypothetical protein EOE67_14475 [Rheinheimera riviphila]